MLVHVGVSKRLGWIVGCVIFVTITKFMVFFKNHNLIFILLRNYTNQNYKVILCLGLLAFW